MNAAVFQAMPPKTRVRSAQGFQKLFAGVSKNSGATAQVANSNTAQVSNGNTESYDPDRGPYADAFQL